MRPEQTLLLILVFATVFFGGMLLFVGHGFDALVVAIAGGLACKFLPARLAANRDDKR